MALVKALVLKDGAIQLQQSGDTLSGPFAETEYATVTNGESSDAITAGMPVYISAANTVKKAKADAAGTTKAYALVFDSSITSGNAGSVVTSGPLSVADWTAVLGSASLTPGADYYLSEATGGKITATAPSTGYVVYLGKAVSTTILQIEINRPIKL